MDGGGFGPTSSSSSALSLLSAAGLCDVAGIAGGGIEGATLGGLALDAVTRFAVEADFSTHSSSSGSVVGGRASGLFVLVALRWRSFRRRRSLSSSESSSSLYNRERERCLCLWCSRERSRSFSFFSFRDFLRSFLRRRRSSSESVSVSESASYRLLCDFL